MKLANRIGAAVLATAMVGTLLTGCGGGSASTTVSTGDGTAAASSTESSGDGDNTYTMFMRSAYVDWIKELKWYDVAEERTGIHVDYISGPEEADDVYSEVDQRVISGDLPDAVMTKLAQTTSTVRRACSQIWHPTLRSMPPTCRSTLMITPITRRLSPMRTVISTACARKPPSLQT